MGFIRSIESAVGGQYNDQFKEVIKCDDLESGILVKRVTTENRVIQNQSRLFVQPGQCAIFVDNGAIKDIITEPGMYFMDTSSPTLFQANIFKGITATFLESLKRVAYQGEVITQQAVYFVSLTEKVGIPYNTNTPILYKDPQWGTIEVSVGGNYSIKVNNPVNLITNVTGDVEEFRVSQMYETITPYVLSSIVAEVSNLNVSFDEITRQQDKIGEDAIDDITAKLESLGIETTKLVVSTVDIAEEVKKSIRERAAIKMKATSATSEEADIYAKLNQAEAMKDLANNQNSAGATVMGMNMGNMFGGMIKDNNQDKDNK